MENLNILLLLGGFTKLSPVQAIFFFLFFPLFLGTKLQNLGGIQMESVKKGEVSLCQFCIPNTS